MRRLQKGGTVDIEAIDPGVFSTDSDSVADPVRSTMLAQEGEVIRRVVSMLPEKYRTCIILFYFNELSYEEISSVMKVSLSNTKILLFRGKKMLLSLYRRETSRGGVTRGGNPL
jgi:RNA polymerase sigma-70 factor (ECF subfamily)